MVAKGEMSAEDFKSENQHSELGLETNWQSVQLDLKLPCRQLTI